ncbi:MULTISPECIES: type II toxin-antitoxin system PemK/MazF family toxin [unclassified Nitratiruptor]|uniref:type II toxin-antitoxin system PemK/MazF family toxin n=1 Tax=unclassified Nitratiruptor TaxID=2624044 RepID=UPI0018EDA13A|nr:MULTISPECIES: type II toxin-antitoxin system PemK/MazF family toxin [unclassified Nitratiruptor]BCD61163.1 mRNA interferase MazF [Nitratiruptor sp. YY08-10]BCD65096.1 hypothetical protein NitYY0814_P27 [Nitratiruptor sp. YY08-14]
MEEVNPFDQWNKIKKSTNKKNYPLHFKEREIYYIRIGKNIGYEQNGKGDFFLRPVLILRKFNRFFFIGIPLTSQAKDDIFHYKFSFKENKESYAVLSQIRAFDANRLERKIGKMSNNDFIELKERIKELLKL